MQKLHLGAAQCALDLGDGSERAEYVNQDYILHKLGRPHRAIGIMYTYYPHDKQWPQRISKACKDMNITFQWDYPYDDYFPFNADGQPWEQMRDIRRHGQDAALTLTLDCSLSDDELREIARMLRPYGRMTIRINHECGGTWFTHNKRFTYEQVGKFFAHFSDIIHQEAPNVRTVFCAGFAQADGKLEKEDEFAVAYRAADVWSADCYLALHYGWPYDVAEVGGGQYKADSVGMYYDMFRRTYERASSQFGAKPLVTAEFNTDGDVTGPRHQGESVIRFAEAFRDHKADWFKAISLYQFRDRGRLGIKNKSENVNKVSRL